MLKENQYYLILAIPKDSDCSSFVTIYPEGYMIQSNIYDATKFEVFEDAFPCLQIARSKFADYTFEVANINSKIFGKKPKFVFEYGVR